MGLASAKKVMDFYPIPNAGNNLNHLYEKPFK